MLNGKHIKIINRTERGDSQAVVLYERPTTLRDDREKTKRDAVTIVMGWVSELRRRKSEEATNGFDSLFGSAA